MSRVTFLYNYVIVQCTCLENLVEVFLGSGVSLSNIPLVPSLEDKFVKYTSGTLPGRQVCQIYLWSPPWKTNLSNIPLVPSLEDKFVKYTSGTLPGRQIIDAVNSG